MINHLLVGVLVLCTLSVVLCQTEEGSSESNRCRGPPRNRTRSGGGGSGGDGPRNATDGDSSHGRGPPIPEECKAFVGSFRAKRRSMIESKEIGICPEPKPCKECWKEDNAKIMSQLEEPTERCKAFFDEFRSRKKNRATTPQP